MWSFLFDLQGWNSVSTKVLDFVAWLRTCNGLATLVFTPTQFTAAFGRASLRENARASPPDTS